MKKGKFGATARKELQDDYRVFYVTAWGYAADHYMGWLPKALNTHREIFALLAHEGSRPKYMKERLRSERPDLVPYTEFLNDMGMTFESIGDCYSYRANQFAYLFRKPEYKNIPVVNIIRHPYVWLEFYVRWRAGNMRMRIGTSDPLAHEHRTAQHAYFRTLGLHEYDKDDIATWASYQGMFQMNLLLDDYRVVDKFLPIERVVKEPKYFTGMVKYLTKGKVEYSQDDLDRAYDMVPTLFPGEAPVNAHPKTLFESWPGWKVDAFRKIVKKETTELWKKFGYKLFGMDGTVFSLANTPRSPKTRPLFVSSMMKSGTWLMRSLITQITDLKFHEPEITGKMNYGDQNLIQFPPGHFFSWHSVLNKEVRAVLSAVQSINVFVIRNIYDLILSMYHHLSEDVDSGIGRSIGDSDYFKDKTIDQSISLIITGFATKGIQWSGIKPHLVHMETLVKASIEGQGTLVPYRWLTQHKGEIIKALGTMVGDNLSNEKIQEIMENTSVEKMKAKGKEEGNEKHFRHEKDRLKKDVFQKHHVDMIKNIISEEVPQLPRLLAIKNMPWILS